MAELKIIEHTGYLVLRLTGNDGLHRLELKTLEALHHHTQLWESRTDLAAIVITGVPARSFAVGASIKELQHLTPDNAPVYATLGQSLFRRMRESSRVYLAAIDGFCLGGGLDLALACDIRLATPRSQFAHPGAKLGIITGFGGTSRLPQTIGETAASRILAAAETITGHTALAWGLVNRLYSSTEILDHACALANTIASGPPHLAAMAKELAYQVAHLPVPQANVVEARTWDLWRAEADFSRRRKPGRS
ncbi:MAG TPA: enoyl-CoA hydratase/isomerase family protein [Acidobacteriota bacterium]|nr:enoyl-CoA hydratase/isomerase family protein [Acidobacteriota bacterium]HMZ78175.1 enoyl-CoA hydratase/isomerase family protein [Acidobacteriota bacterium]HNB70016.1 enoyl-CoA hydratase/isomerase family protein [Acidobacteriota bacterium]HNC43035.1 enoyl-CoA hydratase/isomerase family protein [Acidobacteriota bacterium]HNG91263.1 enoyl-CoA hydratase/isomerase family protein [Acidobacteriota bacterium]